MKPLPDRLPDLSDFLRLTSSDVPGRVASLVADALGSRAALLLLDIDGLYLHPTSVYPTRGTEQRLMGVSVPLAGEREHTLSEVVFDQKSLTISREQWSGFTPLGGEHLAVAPVKMADQIVGALLVGSDEPLDEERLRALPIHVVPRSDGWEVVREGNKKNQGVHQSLELARKHAESMAGNSGAEIVIHDQEEE